MLITGERLSIYDVYQTAVNRAPVELGSEQLMRVTRSAQLIAKWGDERQIIYGVNTGFGELITYIVPPSCATELQVNLIRSHAAGWGEPFQREFARAIMMVRLNCLMKGHSGVRAETVGLLRDFLNHDIVPLVPQHGSLGASGDLGPLSHIALSLIGEGAVLTERGRRPTMEALAEHQLAPIVPTYKEALALINGTSAMTGVACLALVRAATLLKIAVLASASCIQALRGSTRPFESRGHELKNHSGQVSIAAAMRPLLAGSRLSREHSDIMRAIAAEVDGRDEVVNTSNYLQFAYSLRCVPQILGPVLDTVQFCRRIVEEEVNSCNDNPLIMETAEDTFHGGNFHGQYVAMACDYLAVALTEVGVLAERQLNRLVDPHLNGGLPDCLAVGRSGLHCGFEGGQYLATSLAAENLDLAAPSSVKSIPSNGSNQDVVSMGLLSARRCVAVSERVMTILATLVGACQQAAGCIGFDQYSPALRRFHETLAESVPVYQDETAMADVIGGVRALLVGDALAEAVDGVVDLGTGIGMKGWQGSSDAAVVQAG